MATTTTHYYVFDLERNEDGKLSRTRGTGQHFASRDYLQIAHVGGLNEKPGHLFLVTEADGVSRNPWSGNPRRFCKTPHGPVEIDVDGQPLRDQVPVLLAAAAERGPGIEAFAFGRWYPVVEVLEHTRRKIKVVVRTGSGDRPAKLYTPGGRGLRIAPMRGAGDHEYPQRATWAEFGRLIFVTDTTEGC